jgi:hypothetical protein
MNTSNLRTATFGAAKASSCSSSDSGTRRFNPFQPPRDASGAPQYEIESTSALQIHENLKGDEFFNLLQLPLPNTPLVGSKRTHQQMATGSMAFNTVSDHGAGDETSRQILKREDTILMDESQPLAPMNCGPERGLMQSEIKSEHTF